MVDKYQWSVNFCIKVKSLHKHLSARDYKLYTRKKRGRPQKEKSQKQLPKEQKSSKSSELKSKQLSKKNSYKSHKNSEASNRKSKNNSIIKVESTPTSTYKSAEFVPSDSSSSDDEPATQNDSKSLLERKFSQNSKPLVVAEHSSTESHDSDLDVISNKRKKFSKTPIKSSSVAKEKTKILKDIIISKSSKTVVGDKSKCKESMVTKRKLSSSEEVSDQLTSEPSVIVRENSSSSETHKSSVKPKFDKSNNWEKDNDNKVSEPVKPKEARQENKVENGASLETKILEKGGIAEADKKGANSEALEAVKVSSNGNNAIQKGSKQPVAGIESQEEVKSTAAVSNLKNQPNDENNPCASNAMETIKTDHTSGSDMETQPSPSAQQPQLVTAQIPSVKGYATSELNSPTSVTLIPACHSIKAMLKQCKFCKVILIDCIRYPNNVQKLHVAEVQNTVKAEQREKKKKEKREAEEVGLEEISSKKKKSKIDKIAEEGQPAESKVSCFVNYEILNT